jgi:AcrR family transcriptional regulator
MPSKTHSVGVATAPQATGSTRDRLLIATMHLLARQGLAGTGVKQILERADAQFSSLYHHFPGGKDELAAEALRTAGILYQGLVESVWDEADDLVHSIRAVFNGAAQALVDSDYEDVCPIGTVAMEVASSNEVLRQATAEIYEMWVASAQGRIREAGISVRQAKKLALSIITLLEGAFVLCRATRSPDAMLVSGEMAVRLVENSLRPTRTP